MTDKELLQQWIKPYAIVPVTMDATRIIVDALRETLAHPKKEWVGLTDKEVVILAYQSQENECAAIRLAEQALKEKNT
jgi:hypothetical protein